MHVSIGISPRQELRGWPSYTHALEQEGVVRMWLIDSQLAMKDVYVGLATAALSTSSMQLGTGVTNLLTRHPTVTANAIAAIAELSDGRAVLGLGAGDSAVYGLGRSPSTLKQVEDGISFFRSIFQTGVGEWESRRCELSHDRCEVPIHLAVSQERMCRLAGRLADGAIVMGPAQADLVARQVGWVHAGADEAGRRRRDVEISFIATMSATDDDAAALADVRSWATGQARLLADVRDLPESLVPYRDEFARAKAEYRYEDHLSTHAGHQGSISDELVRVLAVTGKPEQCAERLREVRAAGIDKFVCPLMGGNRLERLRLVRDEVLSGL